jgi:anti-sigma B factor antagonist
MKFHARKEGPLTIVTINGNMVGGPVADQFREFIMKLIEQGARQMIFDLTRVPYVASPGVGMIVGAQASLAKRNGELRVAIASERVRNLFNIIRLSRMIKVFEGLQAAIDSFSESSAVYTKAAHTARVGH